MLIHTENVYKVCIAGGRVDLERTRRWRDADKGTAPGWQVAHGPERVRYQAIWPPAASVALAEAVMATPPGLRRAILAWSRRLLQDRGGAVDPHVARTTVLARARELRE